MSRYLGYGLSIIEEFLFLGFISSIIAMVFFHSSPVAFINQMTSTTTYTSVFFGYLFFSLILYPVVLFLSVVCQKKGWLYGDEYTDKSIGYNIFFNIYNDLIFPIYAIINRKNAPVSAAVFISLWFIDVVLLVIGFFVAF